MSKEISQSEDPAPNVVEVETQGREEKPIKVEDLPIEKKIEMLKEYDPTQYYKVGTFVDAKDTVSNWCLGQIVQIEGTTMTVHFDGWPPKWDENCKIISYKVGPFRKYTIGYTGQSKNAFRKKTFDPEELKMHRKKVEELIESDLEGLGAHETTQYYRGELFVFIDYLLNFEYTKNMDDLPEVIEFIKAAIRLTVAWIKKMPSLLKAYNEALRINPEIFLLDENIAIAFSKRELADSLKSLFCRCYRAIKFYEYYDMEVETMEKMYTKNFDHIKFVEKRAKEELDTDEIKYKVLKKSGIVYGQFINFFNYFGNVGGFDAMIRLFNHGENDAERAPLELISLLTSVFKSCGEIIDPEFAKTFVMSVKKAVFDRFERITDKELKDLDKDILGRILLDMKDFLMLAFSEEEVDKIVESTELLMALKFLNSPYLEKKLKGLNEIKSIIDRVELGKKRYKNWT